MVKRNRTSGCRKRNATKARRQVLNHRRAKGRKRLAVSAPKKSQRLSPLAARAEGLPKSARILTRRDFLKVQGVGTKVSVDNLLAHAIKNGRPMTRIGLTVSTKVGNAVVRNRIRRRL